MTRAPRGKGDPEGREVLLSVAGVRLRPDHAEVRFFELARICQLPVATPGYEDALSVLREAAATRAPVRVRFVEKHGRIIEGVRR